MEASAHTGCQPALTQPDGKHGRRQAEEEGRKHLMEGRSGGGHSWQLQQDAEAQPGMSSIQNSKKALEEMLETGTGILTNMGAQRERLKVCACLCSTYSSAYAAAHLFWCRAPSCDKLSAIPQLASGGT